MIRMSPRKNHGLFFIGSPNKTKKYIIVRFNTLIYTVNQINNYIDWIITKKRVR
jgi:hypothetical protein